MSEEPTMYNGRVVSPIRQVLRDLDQYFAIIPESLIYAGQPNAVVVYGALDRIASGGNCFRSLTDLVTDTQLSQNTVRKALAWLEEYQYIQKQSTGDGRLATEFYLPFQSRVSNFDTQGIKSSYPGYQDMTTIQRNKQRSDTETALSSSTDVTDERAHASDQQIPLEEEAWPTWYTVLYSVRGIRVSLQDADAWRSGNGISEDLAEIKAYALRDWWEGLEYKVQLRRNPYLTWQNWCRRDRDQETKTNGNYSRPGRAKVEHNTGQEFKF